MATTGSGVTTRECIQCNCDWMYAYPACMLAMQIKEIGNDTLNH